MRIPNSDDQTAYQVEITPSLKSPAVDSRVVNSTQAEDASLTVAQAFTHDPNAAFNFPTSRNSDIGSVNEADSAATWNVTAPREGSCRLSVLSSTNSSPGGHALFIDGKSTS